MVVKILVPFWVLVIIRHLIFRVIAQKGHNFDNYPYSEPQKVGTWIYDDSCRDLLCCTSGHQDTPAQVSSIKQILNTRLLLLLLLLI